MLEFVSFGFVLAHLYRANMLLPNAADQLLDENSTDDRLHTKDHNRFSLVGLP